MSVPSHSKVTKVDKQVNSVLIEKTNADANELKKDLVVYFQTTKMDRPQLLAQPHPKYPDEIACMVSLVPTFVPPQPQEETEVVENEKPEEVDLVDYTKENDTLFVFIVDRSGSMSGQKMDMTKEALKLFIQSLPSGCLFEIVSFGSRFEMSSKDKKGIRNDDNNVKLIKDEIEGFAANMGGTAIFEPLKYAINGPLQTQ